MMPIFETAFKMCSQIPMSWAFLGNSRFLSVRNFSASMRISQMLLRKAKSGPSGNATVNNVMNPN